MFYAMNAVQDVIDYLQEPWSSCLSEHGEYGWAHWYGGLAQIASADPRVLPCQNGSEPESRPTSDGEGHFIVK